jgi:hypothetical protein
MKKYGLLLGRGIEGTGNTKYAVELDKYLVKTGNTCVSIAGKDKSWGRNKSHNHKIIELKFKNQFMEAYHMLKDCDNVIVLSVPAANYDEAAKDGFLEVLRLLKEKNIPIAYIQVDHKSASISRNFYSDDKYMKFFDYLHKTITHSKDGDYMRWCRERRISTNNILTPDEGDILGFNFEEYKPLWIPFEQKEYRSIRFMGRSAGWKGPWLVRDLHESIFKENGYNTYIEGIELSIGVLGDLYVETTPNRIPRKDVTLCLDQDGTYTFDRNMPAFILPPYTNDVGMYRLRKTQFSIELLLLDDRFLDNVIEYAMFEYIANGTVPIFRKRWTELFKLGGKPLIEYGQEHIGTVILDEENPQVSVELMNQLSQDKEMYDKFRNNAFNFYSKYLNNDVIFEKVLKMINEEKIIEGLFDF